MKFQFYKYHGTGNDFIILDDRAAQFPENDQAYIAQLCHRRFGIGADGLILIRNVENYDFEMRYFNSDGRIASLCGNGSRCAVKFAHDRGIFKDTTTFLAVDGPHEASVKGDLVELKMQDLSKTSQHNGNWVIDTGSPHYLCFKSHANLEINREAKAIRHSEDFDKEGINVNFIEPVNPQEIKVRTFERGVEAETYSCGTGVVASAIAHFLEQNPKSDTPQEIKITTKGGNLAVLFTPKDGKFQQIWLKGPAVYVFSGEVAAEKTS